MTSDSHSQSDFGETLPDVQSTKRPGPLTVVWRRDVDPDAEVPLLLDEI